MSSSAGTLGSQIPMSGFCLSTRMEDLMVTPLKLSGFSVASEGPGRICVPTGQLDVHPIRRQSPGR